MLDAAALAAILDPDRTVPGWWKIQLDDVPTHLHQSQYMEWLKSDEGKSKLLFTGPPDLHTAREHCWRMEEWLEARGYGFDRVCVRDLPITEIWTPELMLLHADPNHAAALNAAIERISNG